MRISPRVGRSNPASSISSVVLPQPLWPRMEQNSRSAMPKLTSSRAVTGSSRDPWPGKTLLTPEIVTPLMRSRSPAQRQRPWHGAARDGANDPVDREPHDADGGHAYDHVVRPQHRACVVDEEAQPGACADELGGHQRHPPDPEAHADPGNDLRKRGATRHNV